MSAAGEKTGFINIFEQVPPGPFSTADFIVAYRAVWPEEWAVLEDAHGVGGKGAGRYTTVFTHIAQQLKKRANAGELTKLEYEPAPTWWGSPVVQYWSKSGEAKSDENKPLIDEEYLEGTVTLKTHLRRERAWGLASKKRDAFRKQHGKLFCEECGLDPVSVFGEEIGESVIEVHHASVMVANMADNHRTKLHDLKCLCANCHRLTHAKLTAAAKFGAIGVPLAIKAGG